MSRQTASSEIKMATTGCPKSSNGVGWMPGLLLPHKAAVACKDWEACKRLLWAATANASIQHKPTQALPEAAPCCCMQNKTAAEFPTLFSEHGLCSCAQKIFMRQVEKILSCNRTRAWPESTNLIFLSFHILAFP